MLTSGLCMLIECESRNLDYSLTTVPVLDKWPSTEQTLKNQLQNQCVKVLPIPGHSLHFIIDLQTIIIFLFPHMPCLWA